MSPTLYRVALMSVVVYLTAVKSTLIFFFVSHFRS